MPVIINKMVKYPIGQFYQTLSALVKKNIFNLSLAIASMLVLAFSIQYFLPKGKPNALIDKKLDSLYTQQRAIKQEKIDLVLSHLQKKNLFNGNVLISEQGTILLKKSYGLADFRTKTLLTPQSTFRIGAISKSFTAMAVLILVQKNKLSLEDSLYRFYPAVPYPNVTIRQLLTHTSGIPDYLSYFYTQSSELMTYARNRNVIAWLENEQLPPNFASANAWEYSYTNYVLLAGIVEKISQQPFRQFLMKEIFQPLGLKNTFLPKYHETFEHPNRVVGFQNDKKTLFDDNFLNKIYGSNGIYASAEDLMLWNLAWHNQALVTEAVLQEAFRPVKLQSGAAQPYGFSWHIQPAQEGFYQVGSWLGFKGILLYQPASQTVLILLSNNDCPVFEELVGILQKILKGERFQRPAWFF